MFNELDSMPLASAAEIRRGTEHTTHYSVVDPAGNAVAVTTTLNDSSDPASPLEGLGFLLNDEMDDFASKQGVPNAYGLDPGPGQRHWAG